VAVTDLGHDLYLIDAGMHDEPERLACYLFDTPQRVLVECGPSRSIGHLFDALEAAGVDEIATLAVTHIHLDHAGGAGHLAVRFPEATIAVHAAGARHLADPARLWASATRVWGEEEMDRLWGPMDPIDPGRIRSLDEGDLIRLGGNRSLEVMATPGHARHHLVYFDETTGGCFVGDAVGIAFPHGHLVQPVTPPPDFDPELVTDGLHRIAARNPTFLGFAHFGPDSDPPRMLAEAEERLWEWVRWVESHPGSDAEAMRRWVLEEYRREGVPPDVAGTYDRNTFWPMQPAGIRRWLESEARDR
jgi:glyoxylase-like metal-dependent hydrolase (beta-lactamase superfamily II)